MEKKFEEKYTKALEESRTQEIQEHSWKQMPYEIIKLPEKWGKIKDTGVPVAHLKELTPKLFDLSKINPHP